MPDTTFLLFSASVALLFLASINKAFIHHELDAIPIVGHSGLLSYWTALQVIFTGGGPALIQQGYQQYPEGCFRIARLGHWLVIVSGPKHVKEFGDAPEHVLSFRGGIENTLAVSQVVGRTIAENTYHSTTIRGSLTKNLQASFDGVKEEVEAAFDDILDLPDTEWKTLKMLDSITAVVARVSNRVFVGLPLCRDQTYLDNSIQFAIDVIVSGQIIGFFPHSIRPLISRFVTSRNKSISTALKVLGPVIEERLAKADELGADWEGKPNDFISWLLEDAIGEERTVHNLVLRVLSTNFAALHTTSMMFTHAIFDLMTRPELMQPFREEAERVVAEEDWTKNTVNNMVKIDSFLRETQRLRTMAPIAMLRKVVSKDGFRFSDGKFLPEGTFTCIAAHSMHYDPSFRDNAAEFDAFRFVREREAFEAARNPGGQDMFKRQMISTTADHLPWGIGKHACPGRFFATMELKTMLAHVVTHYDIEPEVPGMRPNDNVFGLSTTPNMWAKVRFRKRAVPKL
ncbi:cytochrome P450 [Mycena albidolilacea]|uniref:Cytochrome P450 n=1 Tax=Mycena albidolilacea TaxID=1033008 RepID=A0AAD7EC31_9AGAR|nr:cytochrome P450 [Mycena albidolilacea]